MFEGANPFASLVSIDGEITNKGLKMLELNQLGASRRGGSLIELLNDLRNEFNIKSEILEKGRKSDFKDKGVYREYTLISGNY